MEYKKATSIELGKTYYFFDEVADKYLKEYHPNMEQLQRGAIYTKEETQADKVREILKTGWVKRIGYNNFHRVDTIAEYSNGSIKVIIDRTLYTQQEILGRFEPTTYEKALDSL